MRISTSTENRKDKVILEDGIPRGNTKIERIEGGVGRTSNERLKKGRL